MLDRHDILPEISEKALAAKAERAHRVGKAFLATEPMMAALLVRRTRIALTQALQRARDTQDDAALPALTSAIATTLELGFRLCQVPTAPRGQIATGRNAKPIMDIAPPAT
jgi:hypothetical protein